VTTNTTPETVLGSTPYEDGFYSLETKKDRRTASRPNLLDSARRLQEQGHNPEKLSWARVITKKVSIASKLSQYQNCFSVITETKFRNPKNCPRFESR
jgi:hypothetical protein